MAGRVTPNAQQHSTPTQHGKAFSKSPFQVYPGQPVGAGKGKSSGKGRSAASKGGGKNSGS